MDLFEIGRLSPKLCSDRTKKLKFEDDIQIKKETAVSEEKFKIGNVECEFVPVTEIKDIKIETKEEKCKEKEALEVKQNCIVLNYENIDSNIDKDIPSSSTMYNNHFLDCNLVCEKDVPVQNSKKNKNKLSVNLKQKDQRTELKQTHPGKSVSSRPQRQRRRSTAAMRNKTLATEYKCSPKQNTKLFQCSECNYKGNRKDSLIKHMQTHSSTKLFNCSECSYKCNRKDTLKKHMITHSKTKFFKCSECLYECSRKESLIKHYLTHSETKLFKCSECNYECNQKALLKIHLLTHTNTKLFKCSECSYEGNVKGTFQKHMLTHSSTKLFNCSECTYGCNRENSLKLHVLTYHPNYSNPESAVMSVALKLI